MHNVSLAQDPGGDAEAEDDEKRQGDEDLVFRFHGVGLLTGVFSSSEAKMSIMLLVSDFSSSTICWAAPRGLVFSRSRASDRVSSRACGVKKRNPPIRTTSARKTGMARRLHRSQKSRGTSSVSSRSRGSSPSQQRGGGSASRPARSRASMDRYSAAAFLQAGQASRCFPRKSLARPSRRPSRALRSNFSALRQSICPSFPGQIGSKLAPEHP